MKTIAKRVTVTVLGFMAVSGFGTAIVSTYKADDLKQQIKVERQSKIKYEKDTEHELSIIKDRLDKTQADSQRAQEKLTALQNDNNKQNEDIVELKK